MPRAASDRMERSIHLVAWGVALALGLLQVWVHRYSMSIDGVSYLDIAANISEHDWKHVVTGHWSPLFPAVIAVALAIARPDPSWEFPLVHAVELAIYLGALAAFTLLLTELLRLRDRDSAELDGSMLSRALLLVLGYATFAWTTLVLISVYEVTPDLLLAGLLYLAAAMLVRIRREAAGIPTWALLGIALGLGYLAKTVLFVVAPGILAAAYLVSRDRTAARMRVGLAAVLWLAISIPWIALLSTDKGRLTIGDTARDTYVYEVGGLPYRHWQGGVPGFGEPLHPTRLIYPDPPVYEYGEPVDGTYPVGYDPSYWYDGVQIAFSPNRQILAIYRSLFAYFPVVDAFLLVWLVLVIAGLRRFPDLGRALTAYGFLLFPAVFALFLYGIVYVQPRYIAGFWTLAVLALMLAVRLPRSELTPRVFRAGVLAIVLILGARLCLMTAAEVRRALDPPKDSSWSSAEGLRMMGVEPGTRVGWIGATFNPAWARLARVQIVVEIPVEHADRYWSADAETRDEILESFADAGAEVVYASSVPSWASTADWTDLGVDSGLRHLARRPPRQATEGSASER